MHNSKTILATTYAVNPYKGSEDGMGWNFIYQIARFQKVIAITRENNEKHIATYMHENPDPVYDNITFLYFDLPYWMRFWKKGGRGAMLYYWMWQKGIVTFIKKQNIHFDIVHNINFHNDWTPSFLWKLNKPFVWGPIGHHPLIPKEYLKKYSKKYWIKDRLTWMVKLYFWKCSFSLVKTVKNANYILGMNNSIPNVLKINQAKFAVIPSVATEDFGFSVSNENDTFSLISAGRFVPLKGFDLSIHAFADFISKLDETQKSNTKLTLVGSGPEKSLLLSLCKELHILEYVTFIDWIERSELLKLYKNASGFLFPSHEGAGMVVAEALSFGLPVICLDNCGPGEFITPKCGFAIPEMSYENTVQALSDAIEKLHVSPVLLSSMRIEARKQYEQTFAWNNRGEQLHTIYNSLV